MNQKSIGPHEILANGTRVQVKGFRGLIVSHYVAENGVVVHSIQYDQKMIKTGSRMHWVSIEPKKPKSCNYSFVYVV